MIRVGRATSAAPAAVDPFVICEIKPDRYRCLHADKGPMGWTSRGCGAAQGRRRKFIVRTSRNSWRLAAATCRKSHAHCDASPLERVEYALIEDHLEFISAQLAARANTGVPVPLAVGRDREHLGAIGGAVDPLAPSPDCHHVNGAATAFRTDEPFPPLRNLCISPVALRLLDRIGFDLMTAVPAPDNEPHVARSSAAERDRRTRL